MALPKEAAELLVKKINESLDSGDVSNNDLSRWLSGAVCEIDDSYCYMYDFIGDGETGFVVYSCGGDLKRAPYRVTNSMGKMSVDIDDKAGIEVTVQTNYIAKEAALTEAGARHSAGDRAKIQTVHDHSVALGASCAAKEAAKASDSAPTNEEKKQEAATEDPRGSRLIESAQVSTDFEFREAAAISPMVKIISEGRGSSGYYTKEVLQRDGPEIFGRGTLMFINHATEAEQKARPEGDWSKLAAVTEARAVWNENGPDGPALYAPAAVFTKYAQEVKEKAAYTGVSINAYGQYAESTTGLPNPKVKYHESKMAPDGKPGLIAKLTAADSIDLVTKAGRDGKLLLESATAQPPNQTTEGGADDMDAAEFQKLQESNAALLMQIKKINERQAIEDASVEVGGYLKTVSVSEAVKDQVARRLRERFAMPGGIPLTEAGAIDSAKVKALAESETNDELAFLRKVNPRLVEGMGSTPRAQLTEAQLAERAKEQKRHDDETQERFAGVMGFGQIGSKGRKVLAEGRRAFDVHYNARLNGNRPDNGGTLTMEGE